METKKQEAIRLAYGDQWEKVKNHVNILGPNGWVESGYFDTETKLIQAYDNFQDEKEIKKDERNLDYSIWRPKSLSGIEDNNGWIYIESEDDLPKESGKYFIIIGGSIEIGTYVLSYKRWFADGCYYSDTHQNLSITDYQEIKFPKEKIF